MIFLLLFIFIVIIYLIFIDTIDLSDIFCIGILGAFLLLITNYEYFTYRKLDSNHNSLINNMDDTEHSTYGNISTAWDVDTIKQVNPTDLKIDKSDTIDNSDIIEKVLLKNDSHHHPLSGTGFTASNTPYTNPYFLHEKDDRYPIPKHSYPINDSGISLDEALSVKQNHIGTLNKRSLDGSVRNNVTNYFKKYYINELDENASREWFSNDKTDMEVDFRPYDY